MCSAKGKAGKLGGFTGTITQKGSGKKRREEFELSRNYTADNGQKRVITIRGFHHGGRNQKLPDDDSICIRVHDKLDITLAADPTKFLVDCDEQPPDEDNLNEEDSSVEPPDYDPDP